jgi:hypothetical protein
VERDIWIGVQFFFDLLIICIIIYLFYKREKGRSLLADDAQTSRDLVKEGNEQLEKMRISIEEARVTSQTISRELDDKMSQLRLMKVEIEELYRVAEGKRKERASDLYIEAINMAKGGMSADDICETLGLLRGEADLVIALHQVEKGL